jgi:hypothetical protein
VIFMQSSEKYPSIVHKGDSRGCLNDAQTTGTESHPVRVRFLSGLASLTQLGEYARGTAPLRDAALSSDGYPRQIAYPRGSTLKMETWLLPSGDGYWATRWMSGKARNAWSNRRDRLGC